MKEQTQTASTPNSLLMPMPLPLTAWWSAFDYVYGYQIKLVQEFWGFSPD